MRNRIIMAAVEEINLRGFKFTMSNLTKRLSISKSSLYEHFSSKHELISTILEIILNDLRAQEEKIYNSGLPIFEKLKAALTVKSQTFEPFHNRVYEDLHVTYPDIWKNIDVFRKERMDRLTALLIEGMQTGAIRRIHLGVLQQILSSTMNDLISYRFLTENNMTYTDAVAAMLDILIGGLMAEEHKQPC